MFVAAVCQPVRDHEHDDPDDHVAGLEEGDEADAHGQAEEAADGSHKAGDGVGLLAHHAAHVDLLEEQVDEGHVVRRVVPHGLSQLVVGPEHFGHGGHGRVEAVDVDQSPARVYYLFAFLLFQNIALD